MPLTAALSTVTLLNRCIRKGVVFPACSSVDYSEGNGQGHYSECIVIVLRT